MSMFASTAIFHCVLANRVSSFLVSELVEDVALYLVIVSRDRVASNTNHEGRSVSSKKKMEVITTSTGWNDHEGTSITITVRV